MAVSSDISPARVSALPRLDGRLIAEHAFWIIIGVAVFIVAIAPLLYTIDAAFYKETRTGLSSERSLHAVFNVYMGAEYLGYLGLTIFLALLVTLLSVAIGVSMALLVGRTDLPAKRLVDLLVITPLFLSPFTGLIAWIMLGSEKTGFINGLLAATGSAIGLDIGPAINIWSFGGVVWIMVIFFCPFAYLFTVGNLRSMDSSLEEAARMNGATPLQTLWNITLPLVLPAIVASGLLIFILAAEMYTIPGIIGSNAGFTTLPWKIYEDSTVFPVHRAHAAASGTLLLWVTIFGIWLQRRITRRAERFVTITGKGFRGTPLPLGRLKWVAIAWIAIYVMSAVVMPFGALVLSSMMKYTAPAITADLFTLQHYVEIINLPSMHQALWNTAWLAVLCGVICVVIGFLISFMEVRQPSFATRSLAAMGVLPVAVPGLVYGIGLLWLYLKTPLYGTPWVLLLAYIAKFLPYGVIVSRSAILQIHPELAESARMTGASNLQSIQKIVMPLLKPTLIAILFFVMLMSIKELSASVLLYSQRSQVLSVLTWHYMDAGNYQFAAAVGAIQSLMMMALVLVTRAIFRVQIEKALVK